MRVGIDKGVWQGKIPDRALAPIFPDGSYEYIPKSEISRAPREQGLQGRTYETTIGVMTGKPLATYLPNRLAHRYPHFDPDFRDRSSYTYGDDSKKGKSLLQLKRGDLLVFYAGFRPVCECEYPEALYIFAYFVVEKVIDFNELTEEEIKECRRLHKSNPHMDGRATGDLVLVIGNKKKSKLLPRAIRLSERRQYRNEKRTYHAVSREMERLLGLKGSIQLSGPRLVPRQHIGNLKRLLGIEETKKNANLGRKRKKRQKWASRPRSVK